MRSIASSTAGSLGLLFLAIATFVMPSSSQAAPILWGAATGISGDSDVSTAGTLLGAFNIGPPGVGDTTVNGVTFTGLALTGTNVTSGNFNFTASNFPSFNNVGIPDGAFNNLSSPYQTLLSSAGGTVGTDFLFTIGGLSLGQEYEFEWWSNDSAVSVSNLTRAKADTEILLNSNPSGIKGGVGQFAIGHFTADTPNVGILFSGNVALLNGFQFRQLDAAAPVPLPSSLWGSGVLLLTLAARQVYRRRVATMSAA